MSRNIFFQEKQRQGNIKAEFSVPNGQPKRIKVCMVSSEFATKPGASLIFKMYRSLDGGVTWKEPQGFTAQGGAFDPNIPESGIPCMNFSWDGMASKYRIELNIPVQVMCGFSFEVL